MSVSDPVDTESVKSTLVLVGSDEPVTGLKTSLQSSLAEEFAVSEDSVVVSEPQPTTAAMVASSFRRLEAHRRTSMMQPALQVDFEIFISESQNLSESAESINASSASPTASLDAMVNAVELMKQNPMKLLERVGQSLSTQMGRDVTANFTALQARIATPTTSRASVRMFADAWSACGGTALCTFNATAWRSRQVWCADTRNISVQVPQLRCTQRLGPLLAAVEQCTPDMPRPPQCGWHVGNWSSCRSEWSESSAAGQSLCNSSGLGLQQREVHCQTEDGPEFTWPGTDGCEAREKRPREKRGCHCGAALAYTIEGSSGDELEAADTSGDSTAMASAPVLVGAAAGGILVTLCCCCLFFAGKSRRGGQKDKVNPETVDEARMDIAADLPATLTYDRSSSMPESPAAGLSPLGAWVSGTSSSRSSVSQSPASSPTKASARAVSGTPARRESKESNASEQPQLSSALTPLRVVGKVRPRPAALEESSTTPSMRRKAPAESQGQAQRTRKPQARPQTTQVLAPPPAQLRRSASSGSSSRAQQDVSSPRAQPGPRTPAESDHVLQFSAPHPTARVPQMPIRRPAQ